jgi:uncharacterized protein YoxC
VSSQLRVRNVRLVAANRSYSWDLSNGVNVVVGPVGVGKTSLLELIRWGLGGSAQLSSAVRQVGRQLALTVDVGDESLLLLRGIHSQKSRVAVHDSDGRPIEVASTTNPAEANSISHLLMGALQIPEVRVPRSRRKPAGKYTSVSFNDIYGYMYLSQSEIDRSTVNHLDGIRDPKRLSTFEVIYGLIDVRVAEMQMQLGELSEVIDVARGSIREITGFVDALETAPRQLLEEQIRTIDGLTEARERELRQLREQMRDVSTNTSGARRDAEQLANRLTDAVAARERARSQVEDLQRLRSQIVLDEQRTVRSMLAGTELAAIEFHSCPRCLQDVGARTTPDGCCVLCGQDEPAEITAITLGDEVERLRGQLAESEMLLADAELQVLATTTQAEQLREQTAVTRVRADEQAREAVTPFIDRVAVLSEELGSLRGQQLAQGQALSLHNELDRRRAHLNDLLQRQAMVADALLAAQAEREQGLTRIDELSEAFDGILQEFQLPWYEPSHIDAATYLPMVGGKRLEELSSGGMKTLVNNAYFLAGLTYALRAGSETHLPRFMIIDTPRKNFGSDPEDRRAADRIYRWLRRLTASYGSSAFQLIVADNDIPPDAEEFNIIRLSYEEPLITDLPHPGPDAVETLNPR